jgi:tRNA A-37 threonylcarbamoyl transferase component Bud32
MTPPTLTDASALRAAGRQPLLPFRVALADGGELVMLRLLRVLPGKRLVGEAELNGSRVLAKLFIGQRGERHWQQERAGLAALARAGVPTPALRAATAIVGGGYALMTAFLDPAESLAESWQRLSERPPGDGQALALLAPALTLLGRLHAAGLVQEDLHLGNFLRHQDTWFVIDGDAVRVVCPGQRLPAERASANLAILLAQLPATWDGQVTALLPAYAAGAGGSLPDLPLLSEQITRVRAWRLNDFLAKTVRECTLFAVDQSATRFRAVVRREVEALAVVLRSPETVDAAISAGTILKDGGTTTVARVVVDGRALLIKRYNLKSLRHALGRLWRPSRGWFSWREANRLRFLGIATPAPLALIEERCGPLRRRAWLISEFCPGPNLLSHLSADCAPPDEEATAIVAVFAALYRHRISHGDLKATNLLWEEGRVVVIDLDGVVQHRSAAAHARAWRRDRARLLRNWPPGSVLQRWLDERLPAG